jgi:ferrous iron transport protein B
VNCHGEAAGFTGATESLIILAGQPNVGKSVLFKRLTGRYVTVSNYPGTTVEVARGQATFGDGRTMVLDAPGINSLQPQADDEHVTRSLLLKERTGAVVQVADAKNLARALFLTVQFAELDVPLVLNLNMADEARRRGVRIDVDHLAATLGVEVVPTVATSGQGVQMLVSKLDAAQVPRLRVEYDPKIEDGAAAIECILPPAMPGKRGLALMLLAGDPDLERDILPGPASREAIARIRTRVQEEHPGPLGQAITQQRWQAIAPVVDAVYMREEARLSWSERLGNWAVHPIMGWPLLIAALFLVYKFVGEFGAGTLVDFLEGTVFGQWLVPAFTGVLDTLVPVPLVRDFLIGEYGLVTVGLAYGIGIVLPIVSTFFIAFGLLEDSGYLPRLAVLLNRSF